MDEHITLSSTIQCAACTDRQANFASKQTRTFTLFAHQPHSKWIVSTKQLGNELDITKNTHHTKHLHNYTCTRYKRLQYSYGITKKKLWKK